MWANILFYGGHISLFRGKIHPKLALSRPKTMLKQFLNASKGNLKKLKKRLFDFENGQNYPHIEAKYDI